MKFEINGLVPELWCSDFEYSMAFYTQKLGFKIAQQRKDEHHAYLTFQGSQIMIAHWEFDGSWEPWLPKPLEKPLGRGINFHFMINGVQHLYQHVTSRGVVPFLDIYDADTWRTNCIDTRRQFMVSDPDGYLLRFSETIASWPTEHVAQDRLVECA